MPWAALRCGVLDEDWGKHAWDNLLSICCRLQLDFILPGVAVDFSSLDWSRFATTNEQVASLWFVLTHSQGIAPLCEEHALQFTGKPILFGTCAPHQGASESLSPDVFRRLSVAAFAGLLRYHRSDLGDRKLHVAKSEHAKIAKCGFLLPSSSVTVSDLDRLLGESVTLCGHACFNTTCSLESVLKGGADCWTCITARLRPWHRAVDLGTREPSSLTVSWFPMDTSSVLSVPVRVRVSNFWEVSGIGAGFVVTGLCLSRRTVLCTYLARTCSAWLQFCISHWSDFLVAHLPPRCTSMSLDLELAKILDEFAVPEAFRTKLLDSACLKVWQFAEYVDDVKDWTSILSSLEPPIVDRMHIASVRRAWGEDMDAPIESNRRRTLIEEHAGHYRFQLQVSRQPPDTLLGSLDREKDRGTFTAINLANAASVAAQSAHTKHIEVAPGISFNLGTHEPPEASGTVASEPSHPLQLLLNHRCPESGYFSKLRSDVVLVANCLILCRHPHWLGYSKHSWYQNAANHWSVAIGRAQSSDPCGRIAQARSWGRLPHFWRCFQQSIHWKAKPLSLRPEPSDTSQLCCKNFIATSSSETCCRQPHFRSPGATDNRCPECGTSAKAAVFQIHSGRYSYLPWLQHSWLFLEQVLVQVSECGSLLRCLVLLQRTPLAGSLTNVRNFGARAGFACLWQRDHTFSGVNLMFECLYFWTCASIRFVQGHCSSFAPRVRFLGKAVMWQQFWQVGPWLATCWFHSTRAVGCSASHGSASSSSIPSGEHHCDGSKACWESGRPPLETFPDCVGKTSWTLCCAQNLEGKSLWRFACFIWVLGLSPFAALDGRSWLRRQTLDARHFQSSSHRSCACFWRIVSQICARNRFSVRVLVKSSSR